MISQHAKLGIFFILSSFLSFVFVYYVFINTMPFNPMVTSPTSQMKLTGILPQGWAFFTKSPREPNFIFYKVRNNKLELQGINNFSFTNWLGFSRKARIIGAEGGAIVSQALEYEWQKIKIDINKQMICCDTTEQIKILNQKPSSRFFCGEYIIQKNTTVPWAWSKSDNVIMPSEYIKVNVLCAP